MASFIAPSQPRHVSTALDVVILAAGQGKRMHSALPKVLHPLAGKPIVGHVIDAVQTLAPRTICVVYGHGGEPVREALHRPGLAFALQDPPRGTGDAVRAALPSLPRDGVTMVVLGDVPLVRADELARLAEAARRGHVGLLTARVPDPRGLGPHPARRGRAGARDRRGARRHAGAACDRRDQHRRDGDADRPPRALGRGAPRGQRAGRVLPDRRDRDGGRRGHRGRGAARRRRARRARHQRSPAARRVRAHPAAPSRRGAAARGDVDRRSRPLRPARHAHLRARRAHRRRLRVRGRRRCSATASASARTACCAT